VRNMIIVFVLVKDYEIELEHSPANRMSLLGSALQSGSSLNHTKEHRT
jgi:hypothetical protein